MRKLLLFIVVCCLIVFNSFGQKVTNKDLLGKWKEGKKKKSHQELLSINFIDSTHAALSGKDWQGIAIYSIDTSFAATLIKFIIDNGKKHLEVYLLAKISDNNTLKLQPVEDLKKIEWDENETDGGTGILIR